MKVEIIKRRDIEGSNDSNQIVTPITPLRKQLRTIQVQPVRANSLQLLYTVPDGVVFEGHAALADLGTLCKVYVNGVNCLIGHRGTSGQFAYPLKLILLPGDTVSLYNATLMGVEYEL